LFILRRSTTLYEFKTFVFYLICSTILSQLICVSNRMEF